MVDSGEPDPSGGDTVQFDTSNAASSYQDWLPVTIAGGYVILGDRASNLCLDDSVKYSLRDFPCNDLPYQNWY
jgi:hypothetical protein